MTDPGMAEHFGACIRSLRQMWGWQQKELAARIQKVTGGTYSPQYINDLEQGHRGPPPDAVIIEIATALHADPTLLLLEAGRVRGKLRDALIARPDLVQRLMEGAESVCHCPRCGQPHVEKLGDD